MFRSHLALLAVSGLFTLGVISPLAAQVGCDDWPTPAFFKAATAATVQDCLGAGADPNARDEFGHTPLHRAAAFEARTSGQPVKASAYPSRLPPASHAKKGIMLPSPVQRRRCWTPTRDLAPSQVV